MKKRLVFATNNAHKLEEARRIIGDSFEVVSLAEIGCNDDIPETAETLEGNALIKAHWVKEKYGYDCFSDDTGLMVDALGGAPGVYSARYAGEHCTPADNVAKMLRELEGVEDRKAHFATVVALVADGEEHCFEGRVDGKIAHTPHGNGGFGYDPIFVADESGECFAEMTPEAKNEISHRGRAMRKLRDFLGAMTALLLMVLCGFTAGAQQWRIHSSYDGQMERMVDTPQFVYMLGVSQRYDPAAKSMSNFYGVLMRYDKEWETFDLLNSGNVLNGSIVKAIEYNFDKKYLVIAYDDGNVDLLYDNGEVLNVPGLMLADPAMSKTINSISIDPESGLIYLATDFGYVAISDTKQQVETSRVFNVPVKAILRTGSDLWLATDEKLYKGEAKEFKFDNFEEVTDVTLASRMYRHPDGGIVLLAGRPGILKCTRIVSEGDDYAIEPLAAGVGGGLEPMKNGLLYSAGSSAQMFLPGNNKKLYWFAEEDMGGVAGSYDGQSVWISSGRKGISNKRVPGSDGKWTVVKENFFPNASSAFLCSAMAYSPQYGVLVRNHPMDQNFNSDNDNYFATNDLISAYKNLTWNRVSTTYNSDSKGLLVSDPNGIAIDPNNPDHVYCGSTYSGLLRLDLKDVNKSLRFGKKSDNNGGYGHPGFVDAVEDPEENAFWPVRCLFAAPHFDAASRLWTMYVRPVPNEGGSDHTELWYWTAQDRAATTTAANARPFKKLVIKDLLMSNNPVIKPLVTEGNKNILVFGGNQLGTPMIVYDHNGTVENMADDRSARVNNLYDQDGLPVPFNYVYDVLEDNQTGEVWIAHNYGVFVIDTKEIFSNPQQVRRIKVARNDGTGLADHLLSDVRVNKIIVDGNGNKWFATRGAGLMCTVADGREILHAYNTENSPIPGNNIYSLCYNPESNSIMVSTDKGLCELFLAGTAADSSNDVRVFPNPVRPEFHGYVTIDGLASNAMVKIVDTAGTPIKELGEAQLGSIEWDLTNHNHKHVSPGVYFVMATNGPDANKYTKMAKILVIQ